MRGLVVTLAIAVATLAFACDDDDVSVEGSGEVVPVEYQLADFTKVEVTNTFRADISHSDTFSVSVAADDNVIEFVEVTQEGDTLRFGLESGTSVTDATLEATITMPELVSLEVSGASRATVTGFENADELQAIVSGASMLEGVLDVTQLDLELSGASTASLEGGGTEADLDASGASTLDLEDFSLEIARVSLSGASNGTVNVRDELGPVEASGASHLRYIGTPNLSGVDTSGASTVEPVD